MADEKVTATAVAKEKSKTELFKEHLQMIVWQTLGEKVSKDKAWTLFKNVIHGTEEFVVNLEPEDDKDGNPKDRQLPLSGVGTFCVLSTKPRGTKAGLDKDGNPIPNAKVWGFVPRFRFYPSSVTDKTLEQVFGLADHKLEINHYGIFAPTPVEEKKEAKKPAKKAEKKAEKAKKEVKKEAKKVEKVDKEDDII